MMKRKRTTTSRNGVDVPTPQTQKVSLILIRDRVGARATIGFRTATSKFLDDIERQGNYNRITKDIEGLIHESLLEGRQTESDFYEQIIREHKREKQKVKRGKKKTDKIKLVNTTDKPPLDCTSLERVDDEEIVIKKQLLLGANSALIDDVSDRERGDNDQGVKKKRKPRKRPSKQPICGGIL